MSVARSAVFRSLLLGAVLASAPGLSAAAEWNYNLADTTYGPYAWGSIEGYETCGTGQQQSPVDLGTSSAANLSKISFKYKPAPLNVVNNGHTIQVNVDNGSTIVIGENSYRLLQFHFHTPSEHSQHNVRFPMEVHFVHVDNAGTLAVVGAFIEEGATNEVIEAIWDMAPHEPGSASSSELINQVSLVGGAGAGAAYYNYSGSLTTPPCTEGVRWHVLNQPIEASADQISHFISLLHDGHNSRPVQELNGRTILRRVH